MIQEDYVSFDVAKLLKEKGFDEPCDKKYFGDDCSGPSYIRDSWEDGRNICHMSNSDLDDGSKYTDISTPTLQMAMKWFREKYNIVIEITSIWYKSFGYNYIVRIIVEGETKKSFKHYNHYEEACEVGIKFCLENLI